VVYSEGPVTLYRLIVWVPTRACGTLAHQGRHQKALRQFVLMGKVRSERGPRVEWQIFARDY
jgi:hypothetical protein